MADYTLQIIVQGEDQTAPAAQGMERLGAGGIAAGNLLASAMQSAAGAIVGFGASSINVAADFEAGMNRFASVAGSSLGAAGFSLDDVKAKALEMGAVTQFSAAAAQDAMIALAKGGVPVADIMGQATDATLGLAAAGEIDLAQAADIVSKQLGVWGSTGVTAAQVADQLAQAANASTVDVDELALGLANVGGVAKASGVSFGDLTQTMAMIAPGFSSASDAGTSLKSMILALQPTTKPAIDAMHDLGLMSFDTAKALSTLGVSEGRSPEETMANIKFAMQDLATEMSGAAVGTTAWNKAFEEVNSQFDVSKFYDASGSFVGMQQAASLLQGALGGLSEAEQSAALKTMFGTDAFRAASLVVNAGAAGFDAMGVAMAGAGTAAEQAAIRNQGFAFALDSMKGTIETIQIVIGSALLPVLTMLIGVMTENLNGVLSFAQGILGANDPLAAMSAAINAAIPGFSSFTEFLGQAWAAVQPLVAILGANLQPILISLAAVVGGAVVFALGSMAVAFIAAAAPIVALVAIGAALVAAWQSDFGGLQTIVTGALSAVWAVVSSVVGQITAYWNTNGASIVASAQAAWGQLQAIVGGVLSAVWGVVSSVVGQIVAFWQANSASIIATATTAWGQLQTIIGGALQIAGAVVAVFAATVMTVFSGIAAFIQANSATIQSVLSSAWQIISAVVTTAMGVISGVITTVLAVIRGDWAGAWSGLSGIVSTVIGGIVGIVQGAVGLISGAFTLIVSAAGTILRGFIATATGIGRNIIDGIIAGVKAAAGALGSAITSVATGALAAAKAALGIHSPSAVFAAQVGSPIVDGIALGIAQNSPKAVGAMLDLAGKLVDVVSKGVDAFGKLQNLGTLPESAINRFTDSLQRTMTAFGTMTLTWDKAMMSSASQFTAKSGQVVELMSKGVDFLLKLSSLGPISATSIAAFGRGMEQTLLMMVAIASKQNIMGLASAQVFAETSGKIMSTIGAAVDGMKKLEGFVAPTVAQFEAFALGMARAVTQVVRVANWYKDIPLGAAVSFTETAGKIIAVIGTGVDAFKKLETFVLPSVGAFEAFALGMARAASQMAKVANWFTGAPIEAAVKFAESAGKIVAVIAGGVDGMNKLKDFNAPALEAVAAFRDGLVQVVAAIAWVSTQWVPQMVQAAGEFAANAGKIVGILGSGVDGMTKLASFQAPAMDAITAFRDSLVQVLASLMWVSTQWTIDAVTAAGEFSTGAGKSIAIIGGGVDGFTKLATFTGVPAAAIAAFGVALQATVIEISRIAQTFSAEAVAAAGVFASGAGKSVSIIGSGVEGFIKLATFTGVPQIAIELFAAGLQATLLQIVALSGLWSQEALDASARFTTAVKAVTDTLKSALDAFKGLGDFSGITAATLASFANGMNSMLITMQQLVLPAAFNIGANIAIGIANGITSQAGAIQNAVYSAVNAALAAARGALGIASPSKVFEQQIGLQMSAGMAKGVLGGMGGVQAAVSMVGGAALGAGAGAGGESTTNNSTGPITIQVIAAPGQDVDAIARAVEERLNAAVGARRG